jgi:hypothetical protein
MAGRPESMGEIAVKYWLYSLKTNVAEWPSIECSEILSSSPLRILHKTLTSGHCIWNAISFSIKSPGLAANDWGRAASNERQNIVEKPNLVRPKDYPS